MKLNCLIVDDERTSRETVKHFIDRTNFLSFKREAANAIEAANLLQEEDIDVIFLDIHMPEMSGMDLLKNLNEGYEVILVSAEKGYALEAYDHSVTDYLVKPLDYSRFLKAAQKARHNIELQRSRAKETDHLFVKDGPRRVKIFLKDILYIEALADYVIINTIHGRHIVHSTMKGIEKRLPASSFARVHRSYIANIDKIDSLEDLNVLIGKKQIPIGASYKEKFYTKLNMF
jgi:DNA-binding LytR/AlgR family response regulator